MADSVCVELAEYRVEKARRAYMSAVENMGIGDFETANNRAYYSVFNAIRAVLALDSVDFKTHSRTIGYFNLHYIKEGQFDTAFGKMIMGISQSRNKSDYEDFYQATRQEAEANVEGAQKFLVVVEQYIAERLKTEHSQEEVGQVTGDFDEDEESWDR